MNPVQTHLGIVRIDTVMPGASIVGVIIGKPSFPMSIPQRRIDDHIQDLCVKAQAAADDDLQPILQELSALLHEKIERLRGRAARLLLKGEHSGPERRSS